MRSPSVCWLIASSLLVAACAGPGRRVAEVPAPPPPPAPRPPATAEGVRPPSDAPWDARVKLGRPYEVLGQRYTPRDDADLEEVGIASWYGPGFHGRPTANGEIFDEMDISAAHRTLPLPSYVEVTNLDTGRRLVVRVNDRGPFAHDRVIDLSRRAAQLLGCEQAGLARVRVRRITPTPAQVAELRPAWWTRGGWQGLALAAAAPAQPGAPAPGPSAPAAPAVLVAAPPAPAMVPAASPAAPTSTNAPAAAAGAPAASSAAGLMVQIAAFADSGRAAWLAGWAADIAPARVERGADGLNRVRLGPFADEAAARAVLERVRAAGYPGAWLVRPAEVPLG
jgi:rare lipoprotein A